MQSLGGFQNVLNFKLLMFEITIMLKLGLNGLTVANSFELIPTSNIQILSNESTQSDRRRQAKQKIMTF